MKKFLIVVDMQNDFVNGALGSKEAEAIVPAVVKKIEDFDGEIFVTLDTHFDDYLSTAEGRKLPVPHCIKNTDGWQINKEVRSSLDKKGFTPVEKHTFGSTELTRLIEAAACGEELSIELVGLCTDICVVSNALLLKASFPESKITVDSACCAGVTPEAHESALATMRSCQIDIV